MTPLYNCFKCGLLSTMRQLFDIVNDRWFCNTCATKEKPNSYEWRKEPMGDWRDFIRRDSVKVSLDAVKKKNE